MHGEGRMAEQVVLILLSVGQELVAFIRLPFSAQVLSPEEPVLPRHAFLFSLETTLHEGTKGTQPVFILLLGLTADRVLGPQRLAATFVFTSAVHDTHTGYLRRLRVVGAASI